MAEATLQDTKEELSGLTLQGVSRTKASLTEDGKIPEALISKLHSDDPKVQLTAVTAIRKIRAPQAIIDAGLLRTLVSMLDSENTPVQPSPAMKWNAAWAVLDIAGGTSEQTAQVVDAGAIPKLVALSSSPSQNVAENAVWALANIVGDSPSFRDRVAAEGGIDAFVRLLNCSETTRRVQGRAMWAVSLYVKPWPSRLLAVRREAPVDEATSDDDKESIIFAVRSLSRILDRGVNPSDVIKTGPVVPRLVHLLADSSSGADLQKEVLDCIDRFIYGGDCETDATIEAGVFPALLIHLETKGGGLCQKALRIASNIAAGTRPQAHALLDCGLLKHAARMLADDQSPLDCRREACWIVASLSHKLSGDVKVAQALIDEHCVKGLSAALQIPGVKTRELAITAITNLLQYQDPQEFHDRESLLATIKSSSVPQNLRRSSEQAARRS
ncbi:hypothetical protein FRC01_004841 [Tulasnella sp. 417]|nr:hypothetical protein FRC01_004841 [Tulasnella sp. 417]